MLSLQWSRPGGTGRASPSRGSGAGAGARRAGLIALALATFFLDGCSSFSGGRCGGLLSNCNLFRRNRATVVATDPCAEGAVIAAPAAVPLDCPPGAIAVPAAPAVIQSPAAGAPVDDTPQLSPVTPGVESAAPTQSQSAGNRKTLYETLRPTGGTTSSRPESTALEDPLGNLPPLSLNLPQEADQITPPASPPAAPDLSASTVQPKSSEPPATPATDPGPVSVAPGIDRFKVVDPQLAAGSLPTAAGWSFLSEKGYRTAVDLRPVSEISAAEDAATQANHHGIQYLLMPLTPQTLDAKLLDRFEDLIAQAGNRPLYFFDRDGARAAVLWYLRLIRREGSEPAGAAKEVVEIGPKDPGLWLAATALLEREEKARAEAAAPKDGHPDDAAKPAVPAPAPEAAPAPGAAAGSASQPQSQAAEPAMKAARADEDVAAGPDPTAWRPFASLLVMGLCLPLVSFSRVALVQLRRWASHRDEGSGPRALPGASGAGSEATERAGQS